MCRNLFGLKLGHDKIKSRALRGSIPGLKALGFRKHSEKVAKWYFNRQVDLPLKHENQGPKGVKAYILTQ